MGPSTASHSRESVSLHRKAIADANGEPCALAGGHLPRGIRAVRPGGATGLESADAAKHRAVGAAEDDIDSVPHADGVHSGTRANEENVIASRESATQEPACTLEPALARENVRIERTAVAKERHELHTRKCRDATSSVPAVKRTCSGQYAGTGRLTAQASGDPGAHVYVCNCAAFRIRLRCIIGIARRA